MDLENLSSNWKRLQQVLTAGNVTQEKSVRHTEHGVNRSKNTEKSQKHRQYNRIAPPRSHKKRKLSRSSYEMGSYLSSTFGLSASNATASANAQKDTLHKANNKSNADALAERSKSGSSPINSHTKLGKYIALDCEMIGTTSITPFSVRAHYQADKGELQEYSILARATLVNYEQVVIYDAYVLPPQGVKISNFRTEFSGITPSHLDPENPTTKPKSFATVQEEVASFLKSRILVGHALTNDLAVLGITHPMRDIRDTSRYERFRKLSAVAGRNGKLGKGRTPALRMLARDMLGWEIQNNPHIGHDSAEDAKAAMALFAKEKKEFEEEATRKYGKAPNKKTQPVTTANGAIRRLDAETDSDDKFSGFDSDENQAELNLGDESDKHEGDDMSTHDSRPAKKRKRKKKKSKTKRQG